MCFWTGCVRTPFRSEVGCVIMSDVSCSRALMCREALPVWSGCQSRKPQPVAEVGFHAEVLVQREQSRARSREQLEEVHRRRSGA